MRRLKMKIIYYYYCIINFFQRIIIKTPYVKSAEETIDVIISNKASVSRFGDGEFAIMENNYNGFQSSNERLKSKLIEVINCSDDNFIVCIPDVFKSLKKYRLESRMFWLEYLTSGARKNWSALMKKNYYYDALITRPYMIYKDKSYSKKKFDDLKLIWKERDILIVEGEKSRLGVGNNLFSSCKSIKRILAPARNAFDRYDDILEAISNEDKNILVLIALGQTATVLAYDLYKIGYQAIDIGHIDIEYEWFLKGSIKKEKIDGKYVNEVYGGNKVTDSIVDAKYKEQIIYII